MGETIRADAALLDAVRTGDGATLHTAVGAEVSWAALHLLAEHAFVWAFTGSVPEVDRAIERTLDYRHEATQRWLDDVRGGKVSPNTGKPFVWRGPDVVGRGWAPRHGFYDSRELRVVLKFDPSFEAGYRVQTAFPQIEK